MPLQGDRPQQAAQLRLARTPFVHATVVRAQQPTSAHAGDQAIMLSDGTIEGFVGGQCAQNSVRKAALGALQTNQSVLLRVLPDGDVAFPEAPGACVVVNPCLSGGALEIFLVPQVPAGFVHLAGVRLADGASAPSATSGARAVEPSEIQSKLSFQTSGPARCSGLFSMSAVCASTSVVVDNDWLVEPADAAKLEKSPRPVLSATR